MRLSLLSLFLPAAHVLLAGQIVAVSIGDASAQETHKQASATAADAIPATAVPAASPKTKADPKTSFSARLPQRKEKAKGNRNETAEEPEKDGDAASAGMDSSPALLPEGGDSPFLPDAQDVTRSKLDSFLPPGSSHRGVYFPSYRMVEPNPDITDPITGGPAGVNAPMDSLFKSEIVTRLDNDHVQFDRADWVQYEQEPAADGSPQPSMSLRMESGIYDLKNQVLMTNQPVHIETRQFTIEGDTMLHDRISGLTRFTGEVSRVRMTFYQDEPAPALAEKTPEKAPPEAESAGTKSGTSGTGEKPIAAPAPKAPKSASPRPTKSP